MGGIVLFVLTTLVAAAAASAWLAHRLAERLVETAVGKIDRLESRVRGLEQVSPSESSVPEKLSRLNLVILRLTQRVDTLYRFRDKISQAAEPEPIPSRLPAPGDMQ